MTGFLQATCAWYETTGFVQARQAAKATSEQPKKKRETAKRMHPLNKMNKEQLNINQTRGKSDLQFWRYYCVRQTIC